VEEAVVSLHDSGLVDRLDEFVFAIRAAARFKEIEEVG
jgi:hypothetical protein